ncbi:MAG: xanthine dehydrogenase family protein subunit M [Bacteroidota bacterium]|nr:xanthine dehydrogenase family protein subunit M [Bacteroidota bacterium]
MQPFKYSKTSDVAGATQMIAANESAKFLAGGTNILDLMKEEVERPNALIDITNINLNEIKTISSGRNNGGISIGATAKNTDTANHPLVRENLPLLSQAIFSGASPQIRNMASNGGNLNQRTRCSYFYDVAMPCNKREPGSGCGALEGVNRMHAIFGWSDKCVAVHPSDMCVALVALDAVVIVQGTAGERSIPFTEYHRLPGDSPEKDNTLNHDEIIKSIEIPTNNFQNKFYYLKVRDRSSYAFALVSVAAALETEGSTIKKVRLAMGGVAHKPWRLTEAENYLTGRTADENSFKEAANIAMKGAKPLAYNQFKVPLGNKAIVRALMQAMNGDSQS